MEAKVVRVVEALILEVSRGFVCRPNKKQNFVQHSLVNGAVRMNVLRWGEGGGSGTL